MILFSPIIPLILPKLKPDRIHHQGYRQKHHLRTSDSIAFSNGKVLIKGSASGTTDRRIFLARHTLLGELINMNTSFVYNPVPLYRNALEPLVVQEVDRQVDCLPAKLLKYVEVEKIKAQAIAYALNRLPAMYATSERGWEFQQQKAQEKYGRKIIEVVRQGLAAVQLDPLIPVWNIFASDNSHSIELSESTEKSKVGAC